MAGVWHGSNALNPWGQQRMRLFEWVNLAQGAGVRHVFR